MRLIDLDELMKYPIRLDHYDKENGNKHYVFGVESVLEYAEYLPIIDAVPVRHGKWENSRPDAPMFGFYYCSLCGRKRTSPQDRYCPNCGADMRGKKKMLAMGEKDKHSGQDKTNTRVKRESEPLPYNHPHCHEEGYKHLACTYPACDMSCPVQQVKAKNELEQNDWRIP